MPAGTCRLCHEYGELTYEHVPPRMTFNKNTRFRIVPFVDYLQTKDPFNPGFKNKMQQGGLGFFSLCSSCNNFLGNNYVKAYNAYSNSFIAMAKRTQSNYFEVEMNDFELLKVIKHIVSMFLTINPETFSKKHPALAAFVRKPDANELPARYRIFNYLNTEGQLRNLPVMVTGNFNSGISVMATEIAFLPLGHVLTIDFNGTLPFHQEITGFKNYALEFRGDAVFKMYRLPTYLPMLLDYRDKPSIENTIAGNQTE